jgi:hypothetical protein
MPAVVQIRDLRVAISAAEITLRNFPKALTRLDCDYAEILGPAVLERDMLEVSSQSRSGRGGRCRRHRSYRHRRYTAEGGRRGCESKGYRSDHPGDCTLNAAQPRESSCPSAKDRSLALSDGSCGKSGPAQPANVADGSQEQTVTTAVQQ